MNTGNVLFRFVAYVVPYLTLGTLIVGIALKARNWLKTGTWPKARSPLSKWLSHFLKRSASNLILFSKIYKQRKFFWFLSLGFHVTVFMILFGHLRGFGVWSKEILQKSGR